MTGVLGQNWSWVATLAAGNPGPAKRFSRWGNSWVYPLSLWIPCELLSFAQPTAGTGCWHLLSQNGSAKLSQCLGLVAGLAVC
jgi:hypothetical protein